MVMRYLSYIILLFLCFNAGRCTKQIIFGGFFPEDSLEGLQEYSAAKLAVKEINDVQLLLPGYHINLLANNTKRDARYTVGNALQMAELEELVVIIGGASSAVSTGLQSVLSPLGIPQISYASTADILSNKIYSTFSRVVSTDAMNMIALSAVITSFGIQKIGILYADTQDGRDSSDTISEELISNGVEMKGALPFDKETTPDEFGAKMFVFMSNRISDIIVVAVEDYGLHLVDYLISVGLLYNKDIEYPCNLRFRLFFSDGMSQYSVVMTPEGKINVTLVDGLAGCIGVRPYVPTGDRYDRFMTKWYSLDPDEYPGAGPNTEINSYALFAYDSVYLAAMTLSNITQIEGKTPPFDLLHYYNLILSASFQGVTGYVEMGGSKDRRVELVEIINFQNVTGPVVAATVNNSESADDILFSSVNWMIDVVDVCGEERTMPNPFTVFPIGSIISPLNVENQERLFTLLLAVRDFNFDPEMIADNFIVHFHHKTDLESAEDLVSAIGAMDKEHYLAGIVPPIDMESELAVQGIVTTIHTSQIGYALRSSRFMDQMAFPNMLRMVSMIVDQIDVLFDFLKNDSLNWNHFHFFVQQDIEAILVENEVKSLAKENIDLVISYTDFHGNISADDALGAMFSEGYRIGVIIGDRNFTVDILRAARRQGMISSKFAYVLTELSLLESTSKLDEPDVRSSIAICDFINDTTECESLMDGTFVLQYSMSECSKSFNDYINDTLRNQGSSALYSPLPWSRMTCMAYDTIISIAQGIASNMSHMFSGGLLQDSILKENLTSYTGDISFNSRDRDRNGVYTLFNFQEHEFVAIGFYDEVLSINSTPLFYGGTPIVPKDLIDEDPATFLPYGIFIIGSIFIGSLSLIYIAILGVIIVIFRKNPIIKASNIVFSLLILAGSSLPAISLFLQIGDILLWSLFDNAIISSIGCNIRNLLDRVGLFMMISALFIKTFALAKIFDNKKLKLKVITRKRLMIYFTLIVGVYVFFKTVVICIVPLTVSSSNSRDFGVGFKTEIVGCDFFFYISREFDLLAGFLAYLVLDVGANAFMIMFGLYQTYRVRNIHRRFREAREIVVCIYFWAGLLFLGYPVGLMLLYVSRPLFFFLSSLGEVFVVLFTLSVLFLPKIHRLTLFYYFKKMKKQKTTNMLINPETGSYVNK